MITIKSRPFAWLKRSNFFFIRLKTSELVLYKMLDNFSCSRESFIFTLVIVQYVKNLKP